MSGTNKALKSESGLVPPVVILVRPQLGENIGMCARAMLNCAVTEMRIVAPRDGWPNEAAVSAASGAVSVVEGAKIYPTVKDAVADLSYLVATTARPREMVKDVLMPEEAALEVRKRAAAGQKCGILFGPERAGLENDDIALADAILNIPLNPSFSSLNLAQAVLLACHAWLNAGENPFVHEEPREDPAPRAEVEGMLAQLEDELDKGGFFRSADQRPAVLRNIRNYFFRSGATEQEVRTLRGIISCLTGKRSRT